MSCWPAITCAAAKLTASSPEAQKRLICTPGTESPKPAASAPMRAMSPPASPTASTQPSTTSSISSCVEMVAILDRAQRGRGELQRRRGVQRAVRLAASARRADGVVDQERWSYLSPWSFRSRGRGADGWRPSLFFFARARLLGRDRRRRQSPGASQATRELDSRVAKGRRAAFGSSRLPIVKLTWPLDLPDRSVACRRPGKTRARRCRCWHRSEAPVSDDEFLRRDARERHERRAAGLLAHAAMANVAARRRGVDAIPDRAALAAASEAAVRLFQAMPRPPELSIRTPPPTTPSMSPRRWRCARDARRPRATCAR